jgi:hypothetical protein
MEPPCLYNAVRKFNNAQIALALQYCVKDKQEMNPVSVLDIQWTNSYTDYSNLRSFLWWYLSRTAKTLMYKIDYKRVFVLFK